MLSVGGVAEAGKAFVIHLVAAATGRPLLVLASSVKQQEHLFSEISALNGIFHTAESTVLHFPEIESAPAPDSLPDLESRAQMHDALRVLRDGCNVRIVVATEKASFQDIPSPSSLDAQRRRLKVGDRIVMDTLAEEWSRHGHERESQVAGRGQFARRGGILDIFPFQGNAPVRIEFDGDRIESMRFFDVETQSSTAATGEMEWTPFEALSAAADPSRLEDYMPENHVVWREPSDPKEAVSLSPSAANFRGGGGEIILDIFGHDFLVSAALDTVLREQRHDLLMRHWRDWIAQDHHLLICCNNEGEERRLRELAGPDLDRGSVTWVQAPLLRGFAWPSAKLVVLSDAEIFGRYQTLLMARRQKKMARARMRREALDFSQFNEGDFVVHVHHGVAKFLGVRKVGVDGREQEVLTLEYSGGALLHVPVEQAHLVGRYVGVGRAMPKLDEMGGSRWGKAAAQAQRAILDYAAEMLKVEAERKSNKGFACAPDNEWQKEFEDSFLYDETPDQLTAISDTKEEMESTKPMDRLICGDVGFGKTEVAIRAAFKAVMNGKQVAVLAPTTVLAQQHERTFRERMADYPVRIDLVSRFRTKSQQRKSIAAAREGVVDILIGTHRLLQPDVHFKDLGLVVVDEEQRFGVKHKESFKQMFKLVDMLTLSATPIPRTLYLSLMGAKDISTIETPPLNRLPVETLIAAYDERLIRSAIEREIARGGQVYFLHNRVQSIQQVRDRIVELVPNARVEIGHGQMDEDDLEAVMMRFVAGEMDVLVATTIIESGLDIPRANTIIIDRADRFGLADLYQLRGRVGRSQMKAYAYLLLPRHLMIEADARKRVSAIKQYSHLGAGFKVAMRDLEIRGAGNILGTAQSGHATAIGFELYCQLLKETLARMKGEKVPPRVEVRVHLDFLPVSEDHAVKDEGAFIPRSYMEESRLRIEAYRRLAETDSAEGLRKLAGQWQDRFGKLPKPVAHMLDLARIRLAAAAASITSVEVEDGKVMLQKGGAFIQVGGKFPRLDPSPRLTVAKKLKQLLMLVESLGVAR